MKHFGIIPSPLPESPTVRQAVAWVRELARFVGPGFHPDTEFADYLRPDGTRSFDEPTCSRLSDELGRAWNFLSKRGVDIYRVGLAMQRRRLRDGFAMKT